MTLYSEFAEHYEKIFPFREPVYSFLTSYLPPSATSVAEHRRTVVSPGVVESA